MKLIEFAGPLNHWHFAWPEIEPGLFALHIGGERAFDEFCGRVSEALACNYIVHVDGRESLLLAHPQKVTWPVYVWDEPRTFTISWMPLVKMPSVGLAFGWAHDIGMVAEIDALRVLRGEP